MIDLSIAIPVTLNRLRYLLITLDSIKYQSYNPNKLEVVVAVDGGRGAEKIRFDIEQRGYPFRVKVVTSPRPFGSIAHRNHARNAAVRACSSEWIWILDSDQLVERHAINTICKERDAALKQGKVPVLVPVIFNMKYSPNEWLHHYKHWNHNNYERFFNEIPPNASAFSGYASMYKRTPGYTTLDDLQENMPVFSKSLFEAMDGFDESFIGWGGNKHEFSRRLSALAKSKLLTIRLLHNVRLYHQSHPSSRHQNKDIYQSNQVTFRNKMREIANKAGDWKEQVTRVKEAIPKILAHKTSSRPDLTIITRAACDTLRRDVAQEKQLKLHLVSYYPNPINSRAGKHETLLETNLSGMEAYDLCASSARGDAIALLDPLQAPSRQSIVNLYHRWTGGSDDKCLYDKEIGLIVSTEQYRRHNLPHQSPKITAGLELFSRIINEGPRSRSIVSKDLDWCPKHALTSPLIINNRKHKVSLGIITYNRLGVLKSELESLKSSMRPEHFDYDIFITDDGSSDGTPEFLESQEFEYALNPRGGVSAQANRVLSHFSGNVEYGFLANDDLLFKPGWEELYIHAMRKTNYSHFVYMDLELESRVQGDRLYPPSDIIPYEGGYMVNWGGRRLQGALMTFDQKVIDTVGGMDTKRFKYFGHEHVDWTVRCKRARLAPGEVRWIHGCFDVLGSNKFLALNLKDYKRSIKDSEVKKIMGSHNTEYYFNQIEADRSRIFLPLILNLD